MARKHTRRPGSRRYCDFNKDALDQAKSDVIKGLSLRKAALKHGVPKDTIRREVKGERTKSYGRPPILSTLEEVCIAEKICIASEWGFPLDLMDVRIFVKFYLDNNGKIITQFKENLPGVDWCYSFLKRNKLHLKKAQNLLLM